MSANRWLSDLDEARLFLADRGLLSITPSCSLPSLFGACLPNPDPRARGYGAMPKDKWWWPGVLAERPGVRRSKLLGGKVLLMEDDLFDAAMPLCLIELDRAEQGAQGTDAQSLVAFLDQQGPTILAQAKDALGFPTQTMARVRHTLEAVGAIISADIEVPAANGGHVHTSRLFRADQVPHGNTASGDSETALRRLIFAGVRAAVVAPRAEVERWFNWPAQQAVDDLVRAASLGVPSRGWLTVAT